MQLEIEIGSHQTNENIIVCENQDDILLSMKTCQNLGIIPMNFPKQLQQVSEATTKEELMKEFADVFYDGKTLPAMEGAPMKIHLEEDAQQGSRFRWPRR